ncbi:MAG: XRE family transcriptional regulator [Betaproteobacteria bacterium]|nr:XRE family transcriptional regulator [Betaproteobacteria bacterium]
MLSTHYGAIIRTERMARGLTQTAIASSAKVSRTILSQLEQGKPRPVQTDVLDRIFHALGIDPSAGNPEAAAATSMEARRRIRVEHQLKLERQRIRHLRLAVELTANPKKARQSIAAARTMVGIWAKNKTCSPHYINRWTELLSLSPGALAIGMTSLGDWEDALFQNTPWSSAWT